MSEYMDRIKEIRGRWNKTKPAESGGIVHVPEGKYQAEIVKAQFDKESYKVKWMLKITRGEHAGTKLYMRSDLLYEAKEPGKPNGLAFFFQIMKTLGLDYSSPEAKDIGRQLKKAINMVCDVFVKHTGAFQNVYINNLVDASPGVTDEEDTDDSEEEEEEVSDVEDTEEEDDDTEEEDTEDSEEEPEDDEEEEEEEEVKKVILLYPEGTLLTFKHEGEPFRGRYVGPADNKTSVIAVETEEGELEEWEVENDGLSRPPGRPLGAPDKKNRKKKKKKSKKVAEKTPPEEEKDSDDSSDKDDGDWEDEWDD